MNKLSLLKFSYFLILGLLFFTHTTHAEGTCTVKSLKVDPMSQKSSSDPLLYPSFFPNQSNQPFVKWILETENCVGKEMKIQLEAQDTELSGIVTGDGTWDFESVIYPIKIKIPVSGKVEIRFKAGTSICRNERFRQYCGVTGYIVPDSTITFSTDYMKYCSWVDGSLDNGIVTLLGGIRNDAQCYFRYPIPEGWVQPGTSDAQSFLGGMGQFTPGKTVPWVYVDNTGDPLFQENTQEYTGSGECWDETNQSYLPNCYEPISGLPLKDLEVGGDKLLDKIDENTTVGDYLNSLFALAIGVAGVLGVIMIVIYAYEYLTSSNPGGKIELRNKILQVLLGIVLLLGIYTILKTINPDLLRLDPFVPDTTSVNPGTVGTASVAVGTETAMLSIGGGPLDIVESITAKTTSNANNTLDVSVTLELKSTATQPSEGLQLIMGTSPTSLTKVLPMTYSAGMNGSTRTYVFNQSISISTPEQSENWYYKIIDVASGDQVKTSEETIASESCTPLEPTNQTPGTQQEASNKKFYNPKRSEADFIEWVGNCRQSVPALKPVQLTTTSGQPLSVDPCDPDNFVTVSNVFGGKSFQTHKNLKPAIERISQKWDLLSGADKYEIEEVGGNHCRWMTDKEGRVLSNHSYALSIDINPLKNPYLPNYKDPGLARPRSDYTDMPQAFVQLWLDEGFGWGGNWTSKKDAMHFSKIKEEGGNAIVDAI